MNQTLTHEGITYTFSPLTLKDEDEFRDTLRRTVLAEARRDSEGWGVELQSAYLAKVSAMVGGSNADMLSEQGMKFINSTDGAALVLLMASRPNHPAPSVPFETLKKIVRARETDCAEVVIAVLPIPERLRQALQKKIGEARREAETQLDLALGGLMAGQT